MGLFGFRAYVGVWLGLGISVLRGLGQAPGLRRGEGISLFDYTPQTNMETHIIPF